jgi:ATP phosphoribosyltransferase
VVAVSGAAEIAPHIGIADVIVDLVSTGSTLRSNGLHEIATVLTSTARLIARRRGDAEGIAGRDPTREALGDLVQALTSVLRARDKRYVMANVPRAHLAAIRDVLPGLNGPTVVDILDSSWQVAVHAVVDAGAVYRTVAALKALGGEGILVTRIERLTA